jgi:hypothetical protein
MMLHPLGTVAVLNLTFGREPETRDVIVDTGTDSIMVMHRHRPALPGNVDRRNTASRRLGFDVLCSQLHSRSNR